MVRNANDVKDIEHVSFSFLPSLRCNNSCSFCMYGSSPSNNTTLDFQKVSNWMKTVEWDKVIGWGLYGGEPFVDLPLYQRFYELLPNGLPKFVITNGTWSLSDNDTKEFLGWCAGKFHVIISGTREHRQHQAVDFIKALVKEFDGAITYKEEDEEMHPMGRLARPDWKCSTKCIWHEQVTRLGLFPPGYIILQNCDGVYPVIGHIDDMDFTEAFERGRDARITGCNKKCMNINDLLR